MELSRRSPGDEQLRLLLSCNRALGSNTTHTGLTIVKSPQQCSTAAYKKEPTSGVPREQLCLLHLLAGPSVQDLAFTLSLTAAPDDQLPAHAQELLDCLLAG